MYSLVYNFCIEINRLIFIGIYCIYLIDLQICIPTGMTVHHCTKFGYNDVQFFLL